MVNLILLILIASLFFLITAWRLVTYIQILAFQGLLLFGAAFFSLTSMHWANLSFILLETVIVKAIAIPAFLAYILKRNNITREAEPLVPTFVSLVLMVTSVIMIFFLSYASGYSILDNLFFVVSLSTIFTGLYIIMTRRKIITHVMGYLVIENGVFILSLAVGNEMPMMVNMGILLDVFASVLTLGIFINRIGDVFKDGDVSKLRSLKD
jgi:hydrogenase-4 component E